MNQIVLEQADIEKLSNLIGEVPYKHAVPLVVFLNEKLAANAKMRAEVEAVAKQRADEIAKKAADAIAKEAAPVTPPEKPNGKGKAVQPPTA
jgi:hypothetical protein